MKKIKRFLVLILCLMMLLPVIAMRAAAADLDEILNYTITVDVNEDATLHMVYHIDWKVLDSTSEGPLEWVKIGVPNSHYSSMEGRSDAVRRISGMNENGETYARIDLDRAYYAGEVAQIEFELTQDYMYQVDMMTEGETVYRLTPGWFDDIRVDEMTIRWNADKVLSHDPDSLVEGGYCTWTKPLSKGEKYRVTVTYPNDAFGFDTSKEILSGTERSSDGSGGGDGFYAFLGMLFVLTPIVLAIALPILHFKNSANLTGGRKKITRTKVEYYPVCQGCGAARPEGANNCAYCGRSFIKSEEVVEEKDIPPEEKELRRKNTNGLYRYSHDPNTYIRVNVINVPAPRTHSSSRSSGSSRSSSCFHSSCACACACACAGGGRAGCTTKDFYNTDLKLRQLELKKK
jgi:hypothetical protein